MKGPRGLKNREIQLDLDLYRLDIPIRDLSGVDLSVVDVWPDGAEDTLMFVHGYAGCAETWEYQINHFGHQYRVIVPDLRGHGQSDAPFSEYTMPEMIGDLETIANGLGLNEPFVLVGHSFGGSICAEFAVAHPERLKQLILIATAGEYPLPRSATLLSRIPAGVFKPFWRFRPRWNAEIHVMKRMMLNNMRKWKGWGVLEQIQTPTLIITGERDIYFPRRVFDRVKESVPGAEVIDIGASKHKVQLERHQAVNRVIERFIHQVDKGKRISWREQRYQSQIVETRPWLKSYGKFTPYTCPIPRQPLYKFLESAAERVPKTTATVFYGTKLTYQQLNQRVNQFAHALHGLGIRPGDRVMVILPNMPQMIIAYYAVMKIGGVVVLSNPEADAGQILKQIQQTESKVLVTLDEFAEVAGFIQEQIPLKVVLADIRNAVSNRVYRQLLARWQVAGFNPAPDVPDQVAGFRMDQLMLDAPREAPEYTASSGDLAAILYTSGTTD